MSDLIQIANGEQLKCTVVTEKLDILAHVATVTGIRQDRQTSNWTEEVQTLKPEEDLQCLRIINTYLRKGGRCGLYLLFKAAVSKV